MTTTAESGNWTNWNRRMDCTQSAFRRRQLYLSLKLNPKPNPSGNGLFGLYNKATEMKVRTPRTCHIPWDQEGDACIKEPDSYALRQIRKKKEQFPRWELLESFLCFCEPEESRLICDTVGYTYHHTVNQDLEMEDKEVLDDDFEIEPSEVNEIDDSIIDTEEANSTEPDEEREFWMMLFEQVIQIARYRAGLSKCGAQLEISARGPFKPIRKIRVRRSIPSKQDGAPSEDRKVSSEETV